MIKARCTRHASSAFVGRMLISWRHVLFWCVWYGLRSSRTSFYIDASNQGCQIGRFAAEFLKFGRISGWLAARLFGCPFGFFWPFFEGRLAENVFCWPFLKIRLYFKAKRSATTPFLIVSSPVCAFRLVLWIISESEAVWGCDLCLPRCGDLHLAGQTMILCVCVPYLLVCKPQIIKFFFSFS